MIISLTEVRDLLQIPDTTYDTFITSMIPVVQDFVIKYTNNHFEILTDFVYRTANTLTFSPPTPVSKITDSESQFVVMGFVAGLHCRVKGSKFNDNIYKIDEVTDSTLTLSADDNLTYEAADSRVTPSITIVKFPQGIKLPVAQLIGFNIDAKNMKGVQSERLGDHSISYQSGGNYPKSLLDGLNQFRLLKEVEEGNSGSNIYNIYTKQ